MIMCVLGIALLGAALAPAAALARAPETVLTLTKPEISQGQTTFLGGGLRDGGTYVPGTPVTITAQPFPYRSAPEVLDTVTTNANGAFRVSVRPQLNTIYAASAATDSGAVESKRVKAFVDLVPVSPKLTVRGHRAIVSFTRRYPSGYPIRLSGHRVYWYFRKVSDPVFRRIATSVTREPQPYRIAAGVSFALPRSRHGYRFVVTGCYGVTAVGRESGFGRGGTKRCPVRFRSSSARVLPGPATGDSGVPARVGISPAGVRRG